MEETPQKQKDAPLSTAERLTVENSEDYNGIEVGGPTVFPRWSDKDRWERWFDNLIPAVIAATIAAGLVAIFVTIFY